MNTKTKLTLTSAGFMIAAVASSASAVNLTWLDYSPTPYNSMIPNNSVYNLPGVGSVTVTYSIPNGMTQTRGQNPLLTTGNVPGYTWTNWQQFGVTNLTNPSATTPWSVTYTFSGTIPANTLYVGTAGLGRSSAPTPGATVATVNQNGTYLGDWSGGGNYGLSQYTGGAGTFLVQNSVTGPGGIDPWWNSQLAVVQINDPVSSITILMSHLPGDGVGVNIAAVPEPTSVLLLGAASLLTMARRRSARLARTV